MTWIKICGTTNVEDARAAVEAGADAVGFVFAPSPRRIEPERAREIVAALPRRTERVGVFANEPAERIREIVARVGLTAVQLHGEVTLGFVNEVHAQLQACGTKIIRVLKMPRFREAKPQEAVGWDPFGAGEAELDPSTGQLRLGPIAALLFDNAGPGGRGGTGRAFDWSAGRAMIAGLGMASGVRIIVAGGLTPENVGEAMTTLRPWGVDVCSGVERARGAKDHEKLLAFVTAVRAADRL